MKVGGILQTRRSRRNLSKQKQQHDTKMKVGGILQTRRSRRNLSKQKQQHDTHMLK